MKSFFIKVPIYSVILKVEHDSEIKDSAQTAIVSDGCYLLKIKSTRKCPDLHNTIGHEIQHLVFKMLQRAGMRLCDETQEAYCYLNGYLHEQIYKKL